MSSAVLAPTPAVLPHENAGEYSALFAEYVAQFQPGDAHETFLVQQMVAARWRIQRLQRLELALLSGAPGDDARLLAKLDLALLDRLRTSAERSYYRAHHQLTAARKDHAAAAAQTALAASKQAEADFYAYLNAPPPELFTPRPTPEPTRRL